MEEKDFLAEEIYKRYGYIKRARNSFLYTAKGVRLTDLYLEEGRAILGWGACPASHSAFTQFKNVLSRGLTGSFKTEFRGRLRKALSLLLEKEVEVLSFYNMPDLENAKVWEAWKENEEITGPVFVKPPLPWAKGIYLLCLPKENNIENNLKNNSIFLPPVMEAAITRSVYNLIEAIKVRQEKDWFIYDPVLTKYFKRRGPYLKAKVSREKYRDFFLHCLDCGMVINPNYDGDSIVPFAADKGVFSKLAKNPFEI